MRFSEFSNKPLVEVRFGAKDIGRPSYPFTLGFEFEIVTSENDKEDFIDNYEPSMDMEEYFEYHWSYKRYMGSPLYGYSNEEETRIWIDEDQKTDVSLRNLKQNMEEYFDYFPNADGNYSSFEYDYNEHIRQEAEDEFERISDEFDPDYLKEQLEEELGIQVEVFHNYHEKEKSKVKWYLEPDQSISPQGAELVSPVFSYDKGMENLKDVLQFIRIHYSTNSSTGLHVNIGDFDIQQANLFHGNIDLLKLIVLSGETHVLKQFGREHNTYVQRNIDMIKQDLFNKNHKDYVEIIKQINDKILSNSDAKYRFFNLSKLKSHGFIEFRAIGGADYERKEDEIIQTINRMCKVIEISMDPKAFKDDYLKKLTKLFNNITIRSHHKDEDIKNLIVDLSRYFMKSKYGNLSGLSTHRDLLSSLEYLEYTYNVKFNEFPNNIKMNIRELYKKLREKNPDISAIMLDFKDEDNKKFIRHLMSLK